MIKTRKIKIFSMKSLYSRKRVFPCHKYRKKLIEDRNRISNKEKRYVKLFGFNIGSGHRFIMWSDLKENGSIGARTYKILDIKSYKHKYSSIKKLGGN